MLNVKGTDAPSRGGTQEGSCGVKYDLSIQRHQVIKAGVENGWVRCASPNFDIWTRAGAEVQVFYFDDGSINSAQIAERAAASTPVAAARPGGLAEQVLDWLTRPGR